MGKSLIIKNMEIKITIGTYNTSDYRVVKEYKNEKAAFVLSNQINNDTSRFKRQQRFNNRNTY